MIVGSEHVPADRADSTRTTETRPSPAAEGGLRDRKKHATRQALRTAALQLVAERGFAHVTVEDIAAAANVATRTFFNYFSSKESAVTGADPASLKQMQISLVARPSSESPLEALRSVFVEYSVAIAEDLDDLGEGREAWFRRFSVLREDPDAFKAFSAHAADVERGLVEALARRLGKDPDHDPYPALVTATAFAAARVAALYWAANGGEDSLTHLTAWAIDSLAEGLCL